MRSALQVEHGGKNGNGRVTIQRVATSPRAWSASVCASFCTFACVMLLPGLGEMAIPPAVRAGFVLALVALVSILLSLFLARTIVRPSPDLVSRGRRLRSPPVSLHGRPWPELCG